MRTIFGITIKAAARDPFLLFWSLLLPIGGTIGLGLFIKSPDYPWLILTAMIAASILFYAFMTTAYAILVQRRRGVYNLLRVTPMPLWQYICSISSAWTLVAFLCGIMVLTAGAMVFHLPISIPAVFLAIPVMLIAAIGYILFGFSIASVSRTEGHVSLITNALAMPLLFCSNAFYSLDKAPDWFQTICRFNPFQWLISGLRSALSLDWWGCLINTALLLMVFVGALWLAVRTFRFTDT